MKNAREVTRAEFEAFLATFEWGKHTVRICEPAVTIIFDLAIGYDAGVKAFVVHDVVDFVKYEPNDKWYIGYGPYF